jgi:hypothetical protein
MPDAVSLGEKLAFIDGRVLVAIFGAAIAGMLLTLLVAWLIFL